MTDDELRAELLRRMKIDQDLRKADDPDRDRVRESDGDNTVWLMSVVSSRGWPLASQVGQDGACAAWLLAQHADATPDLQRHFHAAMADALGRGEASPREFAYLEDRVRVNAGRKQLYGTQFQDSRPLPIEEPELLDERRAAVGMEPFTDYEPQSHHD
ncbi:DUF6624 domain-containing protein [Nonomuraea rhizosphaerae]|uniref:DUF6624 domain-containing protein n=1 Tax=Nonomuraea rhizosphaerae TaxID=2665663 RepID=UPI001C5D6876|nr:DUF6624 domain-containing protein [Nonomuraea rhizosphaerae]